MKHAHVGGLSDPPDQPPECISQKWKRGREVFPEEAERRSGWEKFGGEAHRERGEIGGRSGVQGGRAGSRRWEKARPAQPCGAQAHLSYRARRPLPVNGTSEPLPPLVGPRAPPLRTLPWRHHSGQSHPGSEDTAPSLRTTFPMSFNKQGQSWCPPAEAHFQGSLMTKRRSIPRRGICRVAQFMELPSFTGGRSSLHQCPTTH